MTTTTLKTRKPTGIVPWPLILVEGGEKTGKSWTMAELTASEKVGQAYWLDLGEGAADEYAAIPGADYLVIEHDGTWSDIHGQVAAVHAEAARAAAAGEKPVVLLVDSMTAEWDMLKDWATARAVSSKFGQRMLAKDPNAEVKPDNRLWNDANQRHASLMRLLMTFPGIAVMSARGKEVAAMGTDGKPVAGQKDYRVEGQKGLAFDSSAWVRLSRDEAPKVIGVRSVHSGVRPGVDRPVPAPSFTLDWLIFDVLKCDPATAQVRDLQQLDHSPDVAPEDSGRPHGIAEALADQKNEPAQPTVDAAALTEAVGKATTKDELRELFTQSNFAPEHTRSAIRQRITEQLADIEALAAQGAEDQPMLDAETVDDTTPTEAGAA